MLDRLRALKRRQSVIDSYQRLESMQTLEDAPDTLERLEAKIKNDVEVLRARWTRKRNRQIAAQSKSLTGSTKTEAA